MTIDEFKRLYTKDAEGHRVWRGATKVRVDGYPGSWYPHLLLREILKQPKAGKGRYWSRTCGVDDCISPGHYTEVRRGDVLREAYRNPKDKA